MSFSVSLQLVTFVNSGKGFLVWIKALLNGRACLGTPLVVMRGWGRCSGLQKGLCIGTFTATGTYIIRSGSILYSILRRFFSHKFWSRTIQNPEYHFTTPRHSLSTLLWHTAGAMIQYHYFLAQGGIDGKSKPNADLKLKWRLWTSSTSHTSH